MKVNTKTSYGLRVLIEIASHQQGILQKTIAERLELSNKYLDQIIAGLKSGGLITLVAGRKSGYVLKKSADKISVYDVYKAFNHELELVDCAQPDHICDHNEVCITNGIWCEINELIKVKLMAVSISSLAEKYCKTKTDAFIYHI